MPAADFIFSLSFFVEEKNVEEKDERKNSKKNFPPYARGVRGVIRREKIKQK